MDYIAHSALLSMGFPRQEYWSGLTFLFPTDLPNPGIETTSPALAGGFFITEPPEKLQRLCNIRPILPQGEAIHVDNHHMPQGKNMGQLSSKF